MTRFLAGLLAGISLCATFLLGVAVAHRAGVSLPEAFDLAGRSLRWPDPRPMVQSTRRVILDALPDPEPTPIRVVLSRGGARLYPGPDLPGQPLSQVLASNGLTSLDVPAYRVSDARWRRIHRCVEQQFDGFAVDVLTAPPRSGSYVTVHMGGGPDMFGLAAHTRGLAPHSGRLMPNAHVFVFTRHGPAVSDVCEIVAHEVGHAIGLDHSRLCGDIMSYRQCGKKRFLDRAGRCGEYKARDCEGGSPTQSSVSVLEAHVGRRPDRAPVS